MLVPYPFTMYFGLLIGVIYEFLLKGFHFSDWILHDGVPREGFIDQNREGIFSLFGYIFLYALTLLYAKFSTYYLFRYKKKLFFFV